MRAPESVLALQQRLFHEQHCSVSTCGWTANFTVASESDQVLERVRALLQAENCVVTDERHFTVPTQGNALHGHRHLEPWRGWMPVEDVQVEEVVEEPEPVILDFRPAA